MPTRILNNISLRKEQLVFNDKFARLNLHFFIMCSPNLFIVYAHEISNRIKQNTKVYKQIMVIAVRFLIYLSNISKDLSPILTRGCGLYIYRFSDDLVTAT